MQRVFEITNPRKRLPPQLVEPMLGNHLYYHGLMFYKHRGTKRPFYYNPYFTFFMMVLYFARSTVSLMIALEKRNYFIYLGDFPYFIHARTHINIAAGQYMMIGISILAMNLVRYFHGNRPVFLEVYDVLAGRLPPIKVGLLSRKLVLKLAFRTRSIIHFTSSNTKMVCLVSFVLSLIPLARNTTLKETIFYGLPWSFSFGLSSYFTNCSYFWHNAYFFVLCHLLKARLVEIDNQVLKAIRSTRKFNKPLKIRMTLLKRKYQTICDEVSRYNETYWSMYICLAVTFLATKLNVIFYAALFAEMSSIVRGFLLYSTVLSTTAIFFILNTASVIHRQAARSRLCIAGLCVVARNTELRSLIKVSTLLENLTNDKIAFTFFNFFTIDFFKFFELTGLIIIYFLMITELSR